MSFKLIKGGNVLLFDADKNASFPKLDVLIEGEHISKIGPNITPPSEAEIIDASNHIVSPGLIDAHRHVFQSQLRTTVANDTLLEYCSNLLQGRMVYMTPEDMYLAQLSGCTEAIWAGVTTVMDHCHAATSEAHVQGCIQATIESGIRSIYCLAPFAIPTSLNPLTLPDLELRHPEQISLFKSLAEQSPLGGTASHNDGRLTLGLGYDTIYYRPLEESRALLEFAQSRGLPVTYHDVERYNMPALKFLRENKLPVSKVTLSHHCDPVRSDISFVHAHDIGIVSTPESEMAMSHGQPSGFEFQRGGCRVGVGVDSPAICSGDLFFAMRLALQGQRVRDNAVHHSRNKLPDTIAASVSQVLYMATLGGAECVHREKDLGSLEVGKRADVVLIRTDSPSMVSSVNLGAAMVIHANAADVDTVIVNGEVVKRAGRLVRVDWGELKDRLVENRRALEERWKDVDWARNKRELVGMWGVGEVLE